MEKKKRRKNSRKKIGIFFLVVLMFLIFVGMLSWFYCRALKIEGKKVKEINVLEEYKDDTIITFLGKDVTSKVKASGKVDSSQIGEYKIIYRYRYFLNLTKKVTLTVRVVDKERPTIELVGGDSIDIYLNSEFKEPGYNVRDNYDKDVKVLITGEVDTSKKGSYYLTYKAKDISGNSAEIVRKVNVLEISPTEVSIDKFDIHDYFDSQVILKQTKDYGDEYLKQIVFVGDSVPWQFGLQGVWDSAHVYAAPCTGPSNIYSQKSYWKNKETSKTIPDLIKENQPSYILVSIGFCEIVSSGNSDLFIKNYKKFIEDVQQNSPSTKIILNSMYPVINETLRGNEVPTNKQVNEYNYYVAKIAQEYQLKYLDSASVVKASNGLAEPSLTASDGYHPNLVGMRKVVEYVKTHGYVEE